MLSSFLMIDSICFMVRFFLASFISALETWPSLFLSMLMNTSSERMGVLGVEDYMMDLMAYLQKSSMLIL